MKGHKPIVLHLDITIAIINRREVERIAHHLSPMLPARTEIMVIEIVLSANMVLPSCIVVMVNRTALIFCIKIFEDQSLQPGAVFHVQLGSQHPVFKIVEQVTTLLLHVPFLAFAISVVVELEHR